MFENWKLPVHIGDYLYTLITGLGGGELLASLSGSFSPGDRAPGTQYIGSWVGSRAGVDVLENRQISCPFRESNLAS